jgi:hypothetical protein
MQRDFNKQEDGDLLSSALGCATDIVDPSLNIIADQEDDNVQLERLRAASERLNGESSSIDAPRSVDSTANHAARLMIQRTYSLGDTSLKMWGHTRVFRLRESLAREKGRSHSVLRDIRRVGAPANSLKFRKKQGRATGLMPWRSDRGRCPVEAFVKGSPLDLPSRSPWASVGHLEPRGAQPTVANRNRVCSKRRSLPRGGHRVGS